MARIPQEEIERIKTEVSVERLVEASGVELKRAGKDLLGRCPFHDDNGPSLVVSPAKNLWHCLGACQAGGSVIDWVMKMNGVSFRHAVELLREGITPLAAAPVKQGTVRKLPAPVALDADDQLLLNQVIGYYHETLKSSPEALAYLESRGLAHRELVERFKLGFANRTLGLRLPERNRVAGAAMRARLIKIGILRESGHEHFNGSLVVPVLKQGTSPRSTGARSPRSCAKARRCTCICRVRTRACGTSRPWLPRRRVEGRPGCEVAWPRDSHARGLFFSC